MIAMAGDEWYAFIRSTAVGPLTFDSLRRMASTGELTAFHRVKHGPSGSWVEAKSVAGIFETAPPHDLSRFVQAQEDDYERALAEIRSGRKRSHWMWY